LKEPPVWLALEGLYAQPGPDPTRGAGLGARLGYRLTDQVSTAVGFSTLFSRGGPVTALAAGFEAVLDITPVAPFLELSLLRVDPPGRAGFSLAQRSGFGADLRLTRAMAIGAVVRYVTALDADVPLGLGTGLTGLEFGLRFVFVPGAF
jgi:hypothetical protein